jgi:PAT family beta-lactamase induction signal transducer AmpG
MPTDASNPQPMWRILCSRRMLVALLMGFSCGLPLLATSTLLQAWMTEVHVELKQISVYALVGLPYTLKFLWAPALDRYAPPGGRRRGWLLMAQLGLFATLIALGQTDPLAAPWLTALLALGVAFTSASQDIVVDAYRREDLADVELGLGSSLYIMGYRIGMLLTGGGALILADYLPFSAVYLILAGFMLIGIATTLLTPEPETPPNTPQTLRDAVAEPLLEYFRREGAWWVLTFILLYKLGDTMAGAITTPFYLQLGFSKSEIGTVVKLYGFWATLAGGFIGGLLLVRLGIARALLWFGVGQMLSTLGFAWLALHGHSLWGLAGVISVENFTGGLGTAAFVAYMGSLTNKRFTATQYALLSSLMGVPRVLAAAPTGWMAEILGWPVFFIVCTLIALPGLWMARRLIRREGGQPPSIGTLPANARGFHRR